MLHFLQVCAVRPSLDAKARRSGKSAIRRLDSRFRCMGQRSRRRLQLDVNSTASPCRVPQPQAQSTRQFLATRSGGAAAGVPVPRAGADRGPRARCACDHIPRGESAVKSACRRPPSVRQVTACACPLAVRPLAVAVKCAPVSRQVSTPSRRHAVHAVTACGTASRERRQERVRRQVCGAWRVCGVFSHAFPMIPRAFWRAPREFAFSGWCVRVGERGGGTRGSVEEAAASP